MRDMDIIQKNQIFRRKSLDTISSPEQLTSYLRVTTPGIWAVLTAVILLLAGLFAWSAAENLETTADAVAVVNDGVAAIMVIMQLEALECGVASLAMVMAYYNKWIPLEQVRSDCGVSRGGSNAKNIYRAAESCGMQVKAFRKSPETIRKSGQFPCIIHWNFNHFVVLCGFKGKYACINDPARGFVKVAPEEFDKAFTGVTLMMQPGAQFEPSGKRRSTLDFARKRMKGAGTAVAFVMLTAVIGSSTYIWKVLSLPMEFFSQRMAGDIQTRQATNASIAGTLVNTFAPLLLNTVMMVFYLVLMLKQSLLLTAIGISTPVLNFFMSRIISEKRVNITQVMQRDSAKLSSATVAGVGMLLPRITRALTGPVLAGKSGYMLISIAICLVCTAISMQLVSAVKSMIGSRVQTKASLSVQAAMMMRVMSMPSGFFRKYSAGELSSRAQSVNQLCDLLFGLIVSTGITSLASLLYITQIFSFAPMLVVPSLLIILITVAFSAVSGIVQIRITLASGQTFV